MKQYAVKALAVSGRANKIHRSGDTVEENQFEPGRADELVASGFLELIGEDGEPISEGDKSPKGTEGDPEQKLKTIGKINVEELRTNLTAWGVPFDPNSNKKALYDLWVKNHPA